MKVLNVLEFSGEPDKKIEFGIAESILEKEETFILRHRIYVEKNYIDSQSGKIDKDRYDEIEKTTHFTAKMGTRCIGSVRLILGDDLPIFNAFDLPDKIGGDEKENITSEVGRLVIDKFSETEYLPRNLILLFLMHSALTVVKEKSIEKSYAFIKENLAFKLERLRFPFEKISPCTLKYPKEGYMNRYFYDKLNPVQPIKIETKKTEKYINTIFEKRKMFSKTSENNYLLRDNLYTSFLKKRKIL